MQDSQFLYNSSGAIDISRVRNNTEMGDMLEAMKAELERARDAGAVSSEAEAKTRLFLTQAAREVRMPVPSKPTLIDHLEDARECLAECDGIRELQADLARAAEIVRHLP